MLASVLLDARADFHNRFCSPFGLPWRVIDAPLKAVAFFVWFNMCPWRFLQDIRNRVYAGDGSRVLGNQLLGKVTYVYT